MNEDLTPVMRNVSYVDGVVGGGIIGGGLGSVGGIGSVRGVNSGGVLQQRRLPLPRSSSAAATTASNPSKGSRSLRSTGFFPATSPSRSSGGGAPTTATAILNGGGLLDSVSNIPPPPSPCQEEGVLNYSPTLEISTQEDSSSSPPDGNFATVELPGIYNSQEEDEEEEDDSSSAFMDEDAESNRSSTKRGVFAAATERPNVKKTKEGNGGLFLAPIELKPDRKFFSFQGSLQYKSQVIVQRGQEVGGRGEEEDRPTPSSLMLDAIHSPPRRPLMGCETRENNTSDHYSSPKASFIGHSRSSSPKQYEPRGRSQHGVTEMADTKELDAIFKSPRNTTTTTRTPTMSPMRSCAEGGGGGATATSSLLHPTVVTPAKEEEEEEPTTTTMITNLPPNQDPEFLQPFPLDDRDYSIPSIRLANAVHRSDSLASYEMYSRTFSDEDESTWEGSFYLDEEDDLDTEASWSTNGGGGGGGGSIGSLRRRQYLRHLSSGSLQMRHLNSGSSEGGQQLQLQQEEERMMSGSLYGLRHLNSSSEGQASSSSIPAIAPSNSFMERMQGITINPRSNTFDSSSDVESYQGGGPPVVLNVESSNPALMIDATQSMDDAEYETRQDRRVRRSNHHNHRSARRRRSSHGGRTSSAVEWIQGLQNPSNGGGVQIVEAASSKFLTGGVDAAGAEKAAAASEDVSKALGMPHPLCRSSTIEAGPFVNRAVAATAAATGLNGIGG